MPSPLTRLMPANLSRSHNGVSPDTIGGQEKPDAAEPQPEKYAGDNNPYRGTETHGVAADNEPRPTQGYATRGVPIRTETPPPNVEPVPVRIVEEGGREIRTARTGVVYAAGTASGNAKLFLGRDENRTFTRIKNSSAVTVYISHIQSTVASAAMNGFPISAGESYETQTQEELYAAAPDSTDDVQFALIIEYSLPIGKERARVATIG